MSVHVSSRVWFDSRITAKGDVLVALALAEHASDDGTGAWPSVGRLVEMTRLSTRGVQGGLRSLESLGVIKRDGTTGAGTFIYSFVFPDPPATTAPRSDCTPAVGAGGGCNQTHDPPAATAPKPSKEPSLEPSVAAARDVDEAMDGLRLIAEAHQIRQPSRTEIAGILAEHPTKSHTAAVAEVKAWAQRDRIASLAGAFRHTMASLKDLAPEDQAVRAVSPDTQTIERWDAVATGLQKSHGEMYDVWLADLRLVGTDDIGRLVLESAKARWINDRWHSELAKALGDDQFRVVDTQRPALRSVPDPRAGVQSAPAALAGGAG